MRVRSHRLLHSERVLKAINEELDRRFRADTIVARHVRPEIAGSAAHPAAARLRAAEALLNRGGFAAEQKIKVEHTDTSSEAMVEKIKRLAIELKLDPAALLGGNTQAMKLIEATAVDVEPVPAAAPAPADITA